MLLQTGMSLGLDRAPLLQAAGLTEADLADRDAYLPFARQLALGRAIVDGRPGVNVSLAASRHISPVSLGVLGYVITHTRNLRDALDAFLRFQRLLTDGVRWKLDLGTTCTLLAFADPDYERLAHPVEALVGLWLTLGRLLTGQPCSPLAVHFRHSPLADPTELERHFGAPILFNAPRSQIVFPLETLALPVIVGKVALMPSVQQLAEARLAEVDGYSSLTARLRASMLERVPQGITNRADLARSLGMSERTLCRRLQEDGTTYRDVLDTVRRDLALTWLSTPHHAIYEVAYLLGYGEPSTFHRSFRRWTGSSPHAWRHARTHA